MTMYNPGADAAARFPDWVIRHRSLGGVIPEVLCTKRKTILIEAADDWPAKRCSLAHAVAHLDLGHQGGRGLLEGWMEAEANGLAAKRLITVDQLAQTLSWSRDPREIAAELDVDLATLEVRRRHIAPWERKYITDHLVWLEEIA